MFRHLTAHAYNIGTPLQVFYRWLHPHLPPLKVGRRWWAAR